jgi:endoglucanase
LVSGNFEGAKEAPIEVPGVDNRVVYSPHVYGPAVHEHPYFQGEGFEQRLPQVWDAQLGWLVPTLKRGVVIG